MSQKQQAKTSTPKQVEPHRASAAEAAPLVALSPAHLIQSAGVSPLEFPTHSTTRPLRQAAVLQLQRQHGNARVQRQLAGDNHQVAGLTPQQSWVAVNSIPLIVEDNAETLQPGQMRKGEFLEQLREAVCAAADEALAGTVYSAVGCPYIQRMFARLPGRSAAYIERGIRLYAQEAAGAISATAYIGPVTRRVKLGIANWLETGQVTGVPADLLDLGGITAPGREGAGESIVNRQVDETLQRLPEPVRIQRQLGEGRPLEGSTRARMESTLGQSLGRVAIHTGDQAAQLAREQDARAFTIGNDVVFGHGEYRPGTPVGDAILAHELAHALQQQGSLPSSGVTQRENETDNALEDDANGSAMGAVISLWDRTKGRLRDIAEDAGPRLRSGLALRRCPVAAGVGAGGAFLYVMLRPNYANAPGPDDPTYESVSELQVAGEAAAIFGVPGGVYGATSTRLGIYGASALAGASGTVSFRGVQDISEGEFSGFDVYVVDATTGAIVGVIVPGGIRLVGRGGTKTIDWLATKGITRSDLATTRALADRAARGPIPQDEVASLLQPQGWTGRASHWWLERRGVVILYRGQGAPTPEIISPLAREQGVAASEGLVARMRAAGLSDEEIAGYVARWHAEPVPSFLAPPGLGGERLGSVGIPTTRIPGIAAQPSFGAQGVVYVLRVPKGTAVPVPQWGLSAENEWVILNKLPEGSVTGVISPSRVPALTVDEAGRLIQAR